MRYCFFTDITKWFLLQNREGIAALTVKGLGLWLMICRGNPWFARQNGHTGLAWATQRIAPTRQ